MSTTITSASDFSKLPCVIIAIGHRAQSGKDQVAKYLHNMFPDLTRIYHFADPLKAYCRAHPDIKMTKKDAALLQRVGTDQIRAANPWHWIEALHWTIDEDPPNVVLLPDCRFKNEVAYVKAQGGYYIDVVRMNPDGTRFIAGDRDPNHPSECQLDDYPADKRIIAVSGDMDSLYKQALDVFCEFMDFDPSIAEAA